MINLKNDYNVIADKAILEELIKYNDLKFIGYGEDYKTKELNDYLNIILNKNVDSYVLAGGTMTNVIGLSQILKYPYEAVITINSSHINVHETGALEASGHKIIYTPNILGKIDIDKLEETYNLYTDNHMVLPKALYLSNATELGECYTLDELKRISNICKKLNLYFFLDGARLPEALVSENYTIKEISNLVDIFYIGGTKLGLPFGELLIIVNDDLKNNFKYLLKNKLGLLAKGFVGAIMFLRFLRDDYYLELAKLESSMADILRDKLKNYLIYPNKTNQVFLKISKDLYNKLTNFVEFEIWENHNEYLVIRFVTSINTKKEEIDEVIKLFN